MGSDPCLAKAGSLGEAWELTEACLLQQHGLRFLLQRLAVFALAVLAALAMLALLGGYAKRLERERRSAPRVCQWALRLLRLALYGIAVVAVISVTGVLELGPVADVGRQLETMLRTTPRNH